MGRLLVVANRLPVMVSRREGSFHFRQSPGGLAVGLAALPQRYERLWIGWPGLPGERLHAAERDDLRRQLAEEHCYPVLLSLRQIDQYYFGFCNRTIWPLFHYFPVRTVYERQLWETYRQVNRHFCDEVLKIARPGDTVWVHDFQLMLLPQMLRDRMPRLQIGFFLHIPWPSFELFRLLPWRREVLRGILGADLIGFHTYDYVRHFLSSVSRIIGHEHSLGCIHLENRLVKIDAFPMGIDYDRYANAIHDPAVKKEIQRIRQVVGERKVVISVDRLDYTKGIVQRLEAFDLFLSENPDYRGKVTLIIVAVPSRSGVPDYRLLRERLEQLVSRVNGEYGTMGYMPVWYLYRFLPFHSLTALYDVADVALVTPLRDGMNLVAKEFVATKNDGSGVLILSEMAGAAGELGEALVVNASDKLAVTGAIKEALEMPPAEQVERNRLMQERLQRYSIARWSTDFVHAMEEVKQTREALSVRRLSDPLREQLVEAYASAKQRLLLLDYDGTLVGFRARPAQAGPDEHIKKTLLALAADPANRVVVVSGRDKETLAAWLGDLGVQLIAEHGAWHKSEASAWTSPEPLSNEWKDTIRPILETFSDRTPGSFVEEKDFCLVWHYRRAEQDMAYVRTHELRDALVHMTENLDVGVFEGSKILEVRKLGISKGRAAELWLGNAAWDFVLAAGDDYTDEEMFAAMGVDAFSIKVGTGISQARFNVDTVKEMRSLLKELANHHDA